MKNLSYLLLIITIVLQSCGGSSEKDNQRTDTLSYTIYKAESWSEFKRSENDSDRTYAIIRYPNFSQRGDTALINKAIINELIKEYKGNDMVSGAAEAAAAFVMRYDSMIKIDPSYTQYWNREINVTVPYQQYPYLCLKFEFNEYTGGAHGMYGTTYLVYNREKNKVVSLDEMYTKEEINNITKKAEEIFRKQEGLSATDDYSNYFFEKGIFYLPSNFTLSKEGLVFHYGLYEIKPYVAGVTEIVVPID